MSRPQSGVLRLIFACCCVSLMKRLDISFSSLQARIKALFGAHAPSKKGIAPVRDWALVLTLVTCGLGALFAVGVLEYMRTDVSVDADAAPSVRPYSLPDESVLQGMVEMYGAREAAFAAIVAQTTGLQPDTLAPAPTATSSVDLVEEGVPEREESIERVDDDSLVPEIVP